MNLTELEKEWENPGSKYRSYPFYALNSLLSGDELSAQIHEMKKRGMGGFFLHSREGLETEYMSEEWFSVIRAGIDAAKETGLFAWLYDEDRFPSGGAGGMVAAADPEAFSAKGMTLEEDGVYDRNAINFALCLENRRLLSFRKMTKDDRKKGETVAAFRVEISKPCEWFNDQAPVDNLNPDAVEKFLQITHEKYKERFGNEFGKTVKGIFTDEPNIADFRETFTEGRVWVPWTNGFSELFLSRRGYRVEEHLPELFYTGTNSRKVRYDFWRTVTERFSEAYSKQIGAWCEKNKLILTGHYMAEPTLGLSVRMSGAVMPHYRFEQMPGIDALGADPVEFLTAKQCSSVANQLGRRSICELYGCSGWDFTFEGQKLVGDWLFAMGIDTRCQHHALYSIKGCRKRDYPPTFQYNSCWFPYNGTVEDYFARISAALSGGKAVRDVLVLHPIGSAWAVTGAGLCKNYEWQADNTEATLLQGKLEELMHLLLSSHIDFDFGDESILRELAEIDGKTFRVGQGEYHTVVLPYLTTVTESTLSLLIDFVQGGGRVICLGDTLSEVDACPSKPLEELLSDPKLLHINSPQELKDLLPKNRVHICGENFEEQNGVYQILKEFEDHDVLFLSNTDRTGSYTVRISIPFTGKVFRLNPLDGSREEIPVWTEDGEMCFLEQLSPVGSLLFLIEKNREPERLFTRPVFSHEMPENEDKVLLQACTKVSRTAPNAFLLDCCMFRLDGEEWSEPLQLWEVQKQVRERLSMRQIYENGSPQRYRWIHLPHQNDGKLLSLRFSFRSETDAKVSLAIELPPELSVVLNGHEVSTDPDGWYLDKSIQVIPLGRIKKGINELLLSCRYQNATELEDCYLLGDFAVTPDRVIEEESGTLRIGDWGLQGYFHYAGSLKYRYTVFCKEGERYSLVLPEFAAVTTEIFVNGKDAGSIPWRSACEKDLTAFLKPGENLLEIEVMGSQRNLMGLFHASGDQNVWTDWTFFSRKDSRQDPEYITVPYGLLKRPYLRRGKAE